MEIQYDIPEQTKESLDNWADKGWQPGGFCMAVLTNNLVEACGRADRSNQDALFKIVNYVYNELPSGCWGSVEKVRLWAKGFEPTENRETMEKA